MPNFDSLNERDRAVLKSIFDPNCALGENLDLEDFAEGGNDEPDESLTAEELDARDLETRAVQLAEEGAALQEALALFERATRRAPHRASAYNNRAQLLRLMGRDEDAMCDLNKAIELTAGGAQKRARAQALCQRGMLRRRLGETDAARQDFVHAADLGSAFAKKQVVELNPYAALCNQMLQQVMDKCNNTINK